MVEKIRWYIVIVIQIAASKTTNKQTKNHKNSSVFFLTRLFVVRIVLLSFKLMAQFWLVEREAMDGWDKEIQMIFMC